jgi:hypothetical protein
LDFIIPEFYSLLQVFKKTILSLIILNSSFSYQPCEDSPRQPGLDSKQVSWDGATMTGHPGQKNTTG